MRGTYACELKPGDRILSGQTFEIITAHGLALDRVHGGVLNADVVVDRITPDPIDDQRVIISTRSHQHLGAHRARVVRTG